MTYKEVAETRAAVALLALEIAGELGWGDPLTAGLIEAKRMLGIVVSIRWPEKLDELLEIQG